jgi:TPR repeat protein
MSAKFGNSDGYFGLAMLSIHEVGYPTPEIADYFEKASSLGHVGANEHLAKFYFMQLRCVKDSSERSELFQKIRFSLERGAAAVSPDNQYNIENYPSFENLYCMSTLSSLYLTRNPITGEKNIDAAATLLKRMYQKYPKETRELLSQLEQKHHDDIALIYKTIGI